MKRLISGTAMYKLKVIKDDQNDKLLGEIIVAQLQFLFIYLFFIKKN
jgi:hypothetical protein